MHTELTQIVKRFDKRRILLVGDFMLDRYEIGDAERISPEAPVPVLRIVERQEMAGGAGSVATIIASLGASVTCVGLVGEDAEGDRLRSLLESVERIDDALLPVSDRPTITKTRMVGLAEHRHRQQMVRADYEVVKPPTTADAAKIEAIIEERLADADLICLEDYAKGLLTSELCASTIAAARAAGQRVVVDPARTSDYAHYRGASILTPNQAELEMAAGRSLSDDDVAPAAAELVERFDLAAMIVTLGRRGAVLVQSDGRSEHFATKPRAVYDNTGAGDAVLAMTAVALASGASLAEAVTLANIAGGLEVSKFGCVPIERDEVLAELDGSGPAEQRKIRNATELAAELNVRRSRGETIVFTNGCFDILHPGHLKILTAAKAEGSVLVVGVNSDASVRALGKGDDRPLRRLDDRMTMLAALECVDYVTSFEEPDPARLIGQIVPDVLVKGSDWAGKEIIGGETVKARGGRIVLIDLLEGHGTTGELERIRAAGFSP